MNEEEVHSSEAYPEAALVLSEAGWAPHPEYGVFTFSSIVCGITPDGMTLHIKDWSRIPPGRPLYSEDTPDTAVEAAEWLKRKFTNAPTPSAENPLTLESLQFVREEAPAPIEALAEEIAVDVPESPPSNEAPEAEPHSVDFGNEEPAAGNDGSADDGPASGGREVLAHDGSPWPGDSDPEVDYEADYEEVTEELGAELLDAGMLPRPDPADFAGEEIPDEPTAPQDHFYGLDDLDRVRRLRIGDVATAAAIRVAAIEAEAGERTGEYAAVQSFVVTNLDRHTGAFTPQDDASLATYHRFVALDTARARAAAIDQRRKAATAFLLEASRDEVVAFDPEAGWP